MRIWGESSKKLLWFAFLGEEENQSRNELLSIQTAVIHRNRANVMDSNLDSTPEIKRVNTSKIQAVWIFI
ncbi:hypothetical protein BSQ33_10305 [Vibrio gazogenes]|uniref:Uncharacterized protein n=1 Tax=Vibrio gazogenes TaxID=687 RepID=A0A1Z2SG40_VIBGA|nr:hypothetical protein BSQ33_10305 [Vibrio gazogenes]